MRGAPLIGVAAAFGIAAEAHRVASRSETDLDHALELAARRLETARPTAVNLAAAVKRMESVFRGQRDTDIGQRVRELLGAASEIAEEDRLACLAIGKNGADWIASRLGSSERPITVLTHCNAGVLATAGIGTALGVIRTAATTRRVAVLSDETRPFFQGARLTAWELIKDGFEVTVLPDVAAAATIASGRVDVVVVGADRIAANGDVANKVGTYALALACRANGVPFVVAAPMTTIDIDTRDGSAIPIEFRESEEVLMLSGPRRSPAGAVSFRIAPDGATALYPAFDVTPADLVDAIVTELGVSTPPHQTPLARFAALAREVAVAR